MNFTQVSHQEFHSSPMRTHKLFLCYKALESEFPTLRIESYFIKINITTKKSFLDEMKNIFSVSNIECVLHESLDEWFYIESICRGNKRWYKCDQIEGVIDCIKEIYSI